MKKKKEKIVAGNYERFSIDIEKGLSFKQVEQRLEENLVNFDTTIKTRSYSNIIFKNTFTFFNFLNCLLGIPLLVLGQYTNAFFLLVVLTNLLIGIGQEIYAKKTIDKLYLLNQTKTTVIREGKEKQTPITELVLDDIYLLKAGDQVPSDSIVVKGFCDVNESLLTGEADPIMKKPGDNIFSGSFLISGTCVAKVDKVNYGNYSYKILQGAKYIKPSTSKIITSINKLLKTLAILCLPIGIWAFLSRYLVDKKFAEALTSTATGIVGMIPQGLILLVNTVFAINAVRLAKKKTMVQDLYATETLSRIDTLCLDKTGTITEGRMEIKDLIVLSGKESLEIQKILNDFTTAIQDENPTITAIREKYKTNDKSELKVKSVLPFASKYKYSGVSFINSVNEIQTYLLGAPDRLLPNMSIELKNRIDKLSVDYRVLLVVSTNELAQKGMTIENVVPEALILLQDKIRDEAVDTFKYFARQGVDIKVISGDNLITVQNIAKRAGIKGYEKAIDLTGMSEEDVFKIANEYTVFTRVSPEQKKVLVQGLKDAGHIVAMTGDGVNDVLALKEADCGIAMASGSDAARNVSEIVLLDSNFSSMPAVVAEGRVSINNLQTYGAIFLVKTIYSMLLTLAFSIGTIENPLKPANLSIISNVFIGTPAFLLSLIRNEKRMEGDFFLNILSRALPLGISAAIAILCSRHLLTLDLFEFSYDQEQDLSMMCYYVLSLVSLFTLVKIANLKDFNWKKLLIIGFSLFLFILSATVATNTEVLSEKFYMYKFSALEWWFIAFMLSMFTLVVIMITTVVTDNIIFPFILKRSLRRKKIQNNQK